MLCHDIVYTCVSCYGSDGRRGTHRGHEQMGQVVTGMQERWERDLGTGNLAALATQVLANGVMATDVRSTLARPRT